MNFRNEINDNKNIEDRNGLSETNNLNNNGELNKINDLDVKEICLSIFLNYSKFSKEEFQFLLTPQNLIKILKVANIMSDSNIYCLLKTNEFDIIYKKTNIYAKNLNLNQFNNFLALLANKLFPKEFSINPKFCIVNFVKEFFNPVNEKIQQAVIENPTNEVFIHQMILNKFSEIQFDNQIILIINSILPGLKSLYSKFFEMELSKMKDVEKIYKNSLTQLIKFCQIHEIMPYIISLDKLAIYFNLINRMNVEEITNNQEIKMIIDPKKDVGNLFTLSKFIALLFHFSVLAYDKYSSFLQNYNNVSRIYSEIGIKADDMGNAEKLILFLENLQNFEISKDEKLSQYFHFRTFSDKYNIIPPRELLNMV